jgi:RNA polymerase sigma-70 factor (ECF subfamily)
MSQDFARVYEDHVWRVYGFLAYRVRERETAEDLTQVTFEHALRAWSRFDPSRASEATWLIAIARNALIDHLRRDRSAATEQLEESMHPVTIGPEQNLGESDALLRALADLPTRDQEVLALRFGGDLTGAQVATMLGLSLANVQQILSRSLRKLREMLEELPGGQGDHQTGEDQQEPAQGVEGDQQPQAGGPGSVTRVVGQQVPPQPTAE